MILKRVMFVTIAVLLIIANNPSAYAVLELDPFIHQKKQDPPENNPKGNCLKIAVLLIITNNPSVHTVLELDPFIPQKKQDPPENNPKGNCLKKEHSNSQHQKWQGPLGGHMIFWEPLD